MGKPPFQLIASRGYAHTVVSGLVELKTAPGPSIIIRGGRNPRISWPQLTPPKA